MLVIHCTELPDLEAARACGEKILYQESGTGNSGHIYIDRNGGVEQWLDFTRVAHHVHDFNERSIGIELVNLGRFPDWHSHDQQTMKQEYTAAQMDSLNSLLGWLCRQIPSLQWIAGHEDLDVGLVPASDQPDIMVRRKLDPGPLFAWEILLAGLPLRRFYPASGDPSK